MLEILVQNHRLDYKKPENIPEHKKQPIIAKQLDLLGFVKGKMNWPAFEYNINFEFFFYQNHLLLKQLSQLQTPVV